MPTEQEVYASHAAEYEELIAHEDHEGNILKALAKLAPLPGSDVLDLGAGTGRLAALLQPLARRVIAFDLSPHMLEVSRAKLQAGGQNWLVAAADHRRLPLPPDSAALIVSGWSVSYVTVWSPADWSAQADAWLAEARRVLRPGGLVVLFESLGTGNEVPQRLPHLENFYGWLDERGFQNRWIRTDYRFDHAEQAARVAGFFFGDTMQDKLLRGAAAGPVILPECTGVWWLNG